MVNKKLSFPWALGRLAPSLKDLQKWPLLVEGHAQALHLHLSAAPAPVKSPFCSGLHSVLCGSPLTLLSALPVPLLLCPIPGLAWVSHPRICHWELQVCIDSKTLAWTTSTCASSSVPPYRSCSISSQGPARRMVQSGPPDSAMYIG